MSLGAYFANGTFPWNVLVDTNNDSINDKPCNQVMTTSENVFLNPNSSKQQILDDPLRDQRFLITRIVGRCC